MYSFHEDKINDMEALSATDPLWGDQSVTDTFAPQKARNAEHCYFPCCWPEQAVIIVWLLY